MTRSLLLHLLATGDRAGTDEVIEQYIAQYEAWLAHLNDARPAARPPKTPSPRQRKSRSA
jgi:hypothetical protein